MRERIESSTLCSSDDGGFNGSDPFALNAHILHKTSRSETILMCIASKKKTADACIVNVAPSHTKIDILMINSLIYEVLLCRTVEKSEQKSQVF